MNFLLIVCDALRYDRVSTKYMPGLAELSKRGANFSFCLVGGGNTLQSTPFILCSKKEYDEEDNIATILRSRGYNTAMIHSNLLLNKFKSGFDVEVDVYLKTAAYARERKATRRTMRKLGIWTKTRNIRKAIRKAQGKERWEIPYRRAENILKEVNDYIDSAEEPWFIWIQLMDAHIPYYPLNYESYMTWDRVEALNRKLIDAIHKEVTITEEEISDIKHLYDEEVRYMDVHLTKFIKEQLPKAKIIVTADHGDEFGEYGFFSHCPGKHGLIPQLIHVPLIFLGDGIQPKIIEDYASSLDISPTILGMAGTEYKLGYGRNLTKWLYRES